eukprot:COSAG06_NODE_22055_length_735_cov_2.430818_1_plen_48_part_01
MDAFPETELGLLGEVGAIYYCMKWHLGVLLVPRPVLQWGRILPHEGGF